MRSSTSRVEAEWTEASRKTAALFTHPESVPASSARSAALSATASSETSPITEIARGLAGWSSVQASVRVEFDGDHGVLLCVLEEPLDDRASDAAAPPVTT